MPLLSIGKGYGKRITLASDSKNFNDNYFYSDTNPSGYGFSLQLLKMGDEFTVYDNSKNAIGEATVVKIMVKIHYFYIFFIII